MFAAKKMKLEPEDLLELQPSDEVTMIGQKMHGRWAAGRQQATRPTCHDQTEANDQESKALTTRPA